MLPPSAAAEFRYQPHRRYDPLADEWVRVSAGRTQRPWLGREEVAAPAQLLRFDPSCHLCPGNTRAGGERNPPYESTWSFTNDFAALQPTSPVDRFESGLLLAEGERGMCRVICFSPRHDLTLGQMSPADVRCVVDLWAGQSAELGALYPWVQVFENRGEAMGASNPHPHGQIWAGSTLPWKAVREDLAQLRYLGASGRSLLLDYASQEVGGDRQVEIDEDWLIVVPFWAAWPYETLVIPRRPVERIPDLDDRQRDGLTRSLLRLLGRYDALFGIPFPYSMGWHQAPFDVGDRQHWQLHAHFYPPLLGRTVRKFMVGYELLSELQRDITAEDAAAQLRAAGPSAAPPVAPVDAIASGRPAR